MSEESPKLCLLFSRVQLSVTYQDKSFCQIKEQLQCIPTVPLVRYQGSRYAGVKIIPIGKFDILTVWGTMS